MRNHNDKNHASLLFVLDLAALALAFTISYAALKAGLHTIQEYTAETMQSYLTMLFLSFLIVFLMRPATSEILKSTRRHEAGRIVRFHVVFALVFALLLFLIKSPVVDSRYLFVGTMTLSALFSFCFHMLYRRFMRRTYKDLSAGTLLGVVATSARAPEIIADVKGDWTRKIAGVFLADPADANVQRPAQIAGVPVLGDLQGLVEGVKGNALDEVLFHVPYETLMQLTSDIEEIKSMGTVVHLYVPLAETYAVSERTVDMIGDCPVVSVAATTLDPSALGVKRMFDILASSIGILLSVPLILLVSIPLKLESRGPLFFSQDRVGRNGRIFRIYKLRSMYADAEQRKAELLALNEMHGPMFKMKDDPRITRVGRIIRAASIDELPQLLNVLKGDMSLVGPRPPLVDEFTQYGSQDKRRLSMRPGLTGIWQVSGRNEVPEFEEVVRMDLQYIDNWSLKLDAKILVKTIGVVLSLSGR